MIFLCFETYGCCHPRFYRKVARIWFILELDICKTNLKVLKHISHNTTSGIKVKMIPGTIKHGCDSTVA